MAGSKSDAFETNILSHIFKNTAVTLIGDAAGILPSAAAGNLYLALYTANPTDSTSGTETVYTNYTRIAVVRSAAGWTVTGNTVTNAAVVNFPACGATGATISGFAICTGSTVSASDQLFWGSLTSNLTVSSGITPTFAIGDLSITED